jgi:hypothetical protein
MISQRQSRDLQTLARLRASRIREVVYDVLADEGFMQELGGRSERAEFLYALAGLLEVDDE